MSGQRRIVDGAAASETVKAILEECSNPNRPAWISVSHLYECARHAGVSVVEFSEIISTLDRHGAVNMKRLDRGEVVCRIGGIWQSTLEVVNKRLKLGAEYRRRMVQAMRGEGEA